MDSHRCLSSSFDLRFLHLTESLEVANGAHYLLGKGVDILGLLSQVNIERLRKYLFERDSLLEQQVKISHLHLEIIASLSLFSDCSWLVSWQLVEKSLHQTRQNIFLDA